MGADFTLTVSGFLAAKSAAAEVKCHEANPPFSVQVCCVWVADFPDFYGICRGQRAIDLFAESGEGLIICWFQVRILAGPPQAVT
jgi:hypothetical protein